MKEPLDQAVQVLRAGGLVALPTETVYGLGADAANELAVRRIFALKGRPSTHPLIVHVASIDDARAWAREFSADALKLANAFWPGPLTLVVKKSPLASDTVTGGQDTVALRVPSHPLALELLRRFGGGIAAPSANRFGHVSPTTAAHVLNEFGNAVDCVLDGGPSTVGIESSIVDVSGQEPRLLRPGGVAREELERVLEKPLLAAAGDVRAPGMLASHYAPRAGLTLVTEASLAEALSKLAGVTVAVIAREEVQVPAHVIKLTVPDDAAGFARVLYAKLREADKVAQQILAVPPEDAGLGAAINDRLRRASRR